MSFYIMGFTFTASLFYSIPRSFFYIGGALSGVSFGDKKKQGLT